MAIAISSGYFEPASLRASGNGNFDPWPLTPTMQALRSAYEYSGDSAILTLVANYYGFLAQQPVTVSSPARRRPGRTLTQSTKRSICRILFIASSAATL
jgi:hypothetical protein